MSDTLIISTFEALVAGAIRARARTPSLRVLGMGQPDGAGDMINHQDDPPASGQPCIKGKGIALHCFHHRPWTWKTTDNCPRAAKVDPAVNYIFLNKTQSGPTSLAS